MPKGYKGFQKGDMNPSKDPKIRELNRVAHIGKPPWNKGKIGVYSKKTLKKMRLARLGKYIGDKAGNWKGRQLKLKCKICGAIVKRFSSDIKKRVYCNPICYYSDIGKPISKDDKRYSIEYRILRREITIQMRKSGVFDIKPSKQERKLMQLFQLYNLPFKYVGDGKHYVGNYNPDFICEDKKKIVEFDGKYWHSRHRDIVKDRKRNIAYLGSGYDILSINEDNLKDEARLIETIKNFLKDTSEKNILYRWF